MTPILEARGLSRSFGHVRAVQVRRSQPERSRLRFHLTAARSSASAGAESRRVHPEICGGDERALAPVDQACLILAEFNSGVREHALAGQASHQTGTKKHRGFQPFSESSGRQARGSSYPALSSASLPR